MKFSVIAAILLFSVFAASAETVYTVDCNGGGDFRTIQECFDALPSKPSEWRTVRIMPGVYREKVTLDVYKDKVRILGDEMAETRIVWDDYAGKVVDGRELTTYDSYTMSVRADEVCLDCLTVENDAGRVGQAVALETRGDRIHLYHCALIGDQDTFFARGYVSRVHVENCHIEGTTDFIFGPSIVLFECSTIHCKADSFITAASTCKGQPVGFVFRNCRLTAAEGVTRCWLGRPWRDYAQTVFVDCHLGPHIVPEGWHDWSKPRAHRTAFYAEYHSEGPGAAARSRVGWSRQLTEKEVRQVLAAFEK